MLPYLIPAYALLEFTMKSGLYLEIAFSIESMSFKSTPDSTMISDLLTSRIRPATRTIFTSDCIFSWFLPTTTIFIAGSFLLTKKSNK